LSFILDMPMISLAAATPIAIAAVVVGSSVIWSVLSLGVLAALFRVASYGRDL
jgi:hypothetical protein